MSLHAQPSNEISIRKEIIYGHADGVDLKFDLAQPITGDGPYPVILFFHGGGWQAGDKSHGHHWIRLFANSEYIGVSVGYRFAPAFPWPSQVHDANTAVRYLRENAAHLNLDPERIGVMGESAGGYLASMVGVTGPEDSMEGNGGSQGFSSRVQAVVSYFSAADFTLSRAPLSQEMEAHALEYYKKPLKQVLADFVGSMDPELSHLKRMSVITYIDEDDPPVQIFQGDVDPFVSLEQARSYENALRKRGVTHELVLVEGGGHGWTGDLKIKTTQQMMAFFNRELKQKK
jgi:acetyl esterase/lipase